MNKDSKISKKTQKELDDLLDIFSTEDVSKKQTQKRDEFDFYEGSNKTVTRKPSSQIFAKHSEKEQLDVSDADDDDIKKILQDTRDMDGDLFQTLSNTNKKSSNPLIQTMPIQSNSSKPSILKKTKSFDDDDAFDDLDNLISKKVLQHDVPSNKKVETKSKSLFDDIEDTMLDKMGFDNETKKSNDLKKPSIADELFNRNESKLLFDNKPVTGDTDEVGDVTFGAYVPSSTRSRSTSASRRRSVKFEEDFLEPPLQKTYSQTEKEDTILKPLQSQTKSNYDWLGISTDSDNGTAPKTTNFNDWIIPNKKEESQVPEVSDVKPQKPLQFKEDWLGLNDSPTNNSFDLDYKSEKKLTTQNETQKPTNNEIFKIQEDKKANMIKNEKNFHELKTQNHTDVLEKSSHDTYSQKFYRNETASNQSLNWMDNILTNKTVEKDEKPVKPITLNMPTNSVQLNNQKEYFNVNEYSNTNLQEVNTLILRIKQLEFENDNLKTYNDQMKENYELKVNLVKEGYENRVNIMKQNFEMIKNHYNEEKDLLNKQFEFIEKEKQELILIHRKKYDEVLKEANMENQKLKEMQKNLFENLKNEHEQAIKRIKELKTDEIDAAMTASSHTRTIESVLNSIIENTKNIDSLSQKVEINHMMNLSEKETEIKLKEDHLKVQEVRAAKQLKDYETETRNLRDTINRLENHLAEQIKLVEEEKWKNKQQEKKLEALQEGLLNEQKIVMEKLTRERLDIDRAKDDILIEQKRIMEQLYEERRKLMEEKTHFEITLQTYKNQQHKDSMKNVNLEAEINVSSKYLKEEKLRIEKLEKSLQQQEDQLRIQKQKLDERKSDLDRKEIQIQERLHVGNQKYTDAEILYENAKKESERNIELLKQTSALKTTHDNRLQQIQQQLQSLNEKENSLNKEKVFILKMKQELEMYKDSIICSKCKKQSNDFGTSNFIGSTTIGYNSLLAATYPAVTANKNQTSKMFNTGNINLNDAKQIRQLKLHALKERYYLNQEKEFINTLRNSYTKSLSLNQLNKIGVFNKV